MKNKIIFFIVCNLATVGLSAQDGWYTEGDFEPVTRVKIVVENTLNIDRADCPVLILRNEMPVTDLMETWVTVVDPQLPSQPEPTQDQLKKFGGHLSRKETNGHFVQYQLDDIDQDGIWDELFFMTDLKAGESRNFYLYIGVTSRGMYEHETHAEVGNYGRHNVPIWESKSVGWKLWYPTDVDMLMKPRPVLVGNMEDVLNLSGYNVPPEFGIDGMTVSNTFGAGGMCLFENHQNYKDLSRPRFSPYRDKGPLYNTRYAYTVLANGPIRSLVKVKTMNWQTGKGIYELVQYYAAYKNKSYSTCKVVFEKFIPEGEMPDFGCGIRAIMNEENVFLDSGIVISNGKNVTLLNPTQYEPFHNKVVVDFEGIALIVKEKYKPDYQFIPLPTGKEQEVMMKLDGIQKDMIIGENHTFRIPLTDDLSFEYMMAAGWSKGYLNKSPEEFQQYVKSEALKYNNPVKVMIHGLEEKE